MPSFLLQSSETDCAAKLVYDDSDVVWESEISFGLEHGACNDFTFIDSITASHAFANVFFRTFL